jgi:L-threonylcarbamoyladenylate synthase
MITEIIPVDFAQTLDRAVDSLTAGSLVAFPTDTVYGIGALAFNPQAIEQLYAVKGRDSAKAIAVLVGSPADLPRVAAEMGDMAQRLAQRFWPGPLTLVVPRHPALPENISPLPTVGVRMPDLPFTLALLSRAGPLATTSANHSGASSPSTAQEVMDQLNGRIPLILDGGHTPGGVSSTVVDCTGLEPVILRLGPVSLQQLQAALA